MTTLHPEIQRCYDLAIKGAWEHPFFLIPLGHVEWTIVDDAQHPVKTMAVSSTLRGGRPVIGLYVNAEWCKQLDDSYVFGILAHEMMHCLLAHHDRRAARDPGLWNIATDMAINTRLREAGIKLPADIFYAEKGQEDWTAEEIYEHLLQNAKTMHGDPSSVGRGCGVIDDSSGIDDSDAGQAGDSPPGQSASRAWGELTAQAAAYSRGQGTSTALSKMFKKQLVKTPWKRLIRQAASRAAAKGGRDVQSFRKSNRRSNDIIFPGWLSTSPSISIIIDTSGSVSDEMLETALSNVIDLARISSVKIFLALHDGTCYWSGWVTPDVSISQLSALCTARGGTDPQGAFAAVAAVRARFDVAVYLTDGELSGYPARPSTVKRMIVGIVGSGRHGAAIPTGWQMIPVDL